MRMRINYSGNTAPAALVVVVVLMMVVPPVRAAERGPGGRALYLAQCAACHGADGKGKGRAALDFTVPPTDLTSDAMTDLTEKELLRKLVYPPKPMPNYRDLLTEAERVQVVQYLRTLAPQPVATTGGR